MQTVRIKVMLLSVINPTSYIMYNVLFFTSNAYILLLHYAITINVCIRSVFESYKIIPPRQFLLRQINQFSE